MSKSEAKDINTIIKPTGTKTLKKTAMYYVKCSFTLKWSELLNVSCMGDV